MLRWFRHVDGMSESRLTKGSNKADVSGNPGKGRSRRIHTALISELLREVQVCSTRKRRACMIRCMKLDEARGV